LPSAPPLYYVETDILPTAAGSQRANGRLAFGAAGEIWYTSHYYDGFIQIRGAVGANRKRPPWVDPATPERPWINVQQVVPWVRYPPPYLVSSSRVAELRGKLKRAGFSVVDARLEESADNPEREFLKELTRRLGFQEAGAGNWMAFADRLSDFLSGTESAPYAVIINGLDALARSSLYYFLRCVHNLLLIRETAPLSDVTANRQIEFFFVGEWEPEEIQGTHQ
jgi:hypothetical protein